MKTDDSDYSDDGGRVIVLIAILVAFIYIGSQRQPATPAVPPVKPDAPAKKCPGPCPRHRLFRMLDCPDCAQQESFENAR